MVKIAIAGLGGVGRATANLLLSRRARYRRVYEADVRLVCPHGLNRGESAISFATAAT